MPTIDPIQAGFHSGEFSGSARGRVDLPGYRYALAFCENWIPKPQGSLFMRRGTIKTVTPPDRPRTFTVRLSSRADQLVLSFTPGQMRVYEDNGTAEPVEISLIEDGSFEKYSSESPWDVIGGNQAEMNDIATGNLYGYCRLSADGAWFKQIVPTVVGHEYTLRFRGRVNTDVAGDLVTVLGQTFAGTSAWQEYEHTFVAAGAATEIKFTRPAGGQDGNITDVTLVDDDDVLTTFWATPWQAEHLADLALIFDARRQFGFMLHPDVPPHVIRYARGVWQVYPAGFVVAFDFGTGVASISGRLPREWVAGNYPSIGEFGFQGRVWFGGTRNEPGRFWAVSSRSPFDLRVGVDDDDALDFTLDTKGAITWMHRQAALLIGTAEQEHMVEGSSGPITPSDVKAVDQSEYGSARIPTVGLGDLVIYTARDKKNLRAIGYDWQKSGWASRSLTYLAEHILRAGVMEVHRITSPFSGLLVVLADGTLRLCVFDRSEGLMAWSRLDVGGEVATATIVERPAGTEAWLTVSRGGVWKIERLPFHEEKVWAPLSHVAMDYVPFADAAASSAVINDGVTPQYATAAGFADGTEVVVVQPGGHQFSTVQGGKAPAEALDPDADWTYIGIPFRAKATTLPLEGANPAGTSQGHLVHYADITARVHESAAPLLNGARAGAGRPFDNAPAATDLVTADLKVTDMKVAVGGQIDIEQDLPLRTEVCAVFGRASASKV